MKRSPATLHGLLALAVLAPRTIAQAQFDWLATHDGLQVQQPDYGRGAAADASGNVFLVSEVRLSAGLNDSNVDTNKYSAAGALLWTRRFDVLSSTSDRADDIAVASNGDVCIVGTGSAPDNDLFLLRYDTNGSLLWDLRYGGAPGAGVDGGSRLAFDALGNIVVAGTVTNASGGADMLVKAFTPAGAPLWETRVDSAQHGSDGALDLCIDAAGSIFVAGYVDRGGVYDAGVAKLDNLGQLNWLRPANISNSGGLADEFSRIVPDGQGGVIATGRGQYKITFPFQTFTIGLAVRVSTDGNLLWTRTYGGLALCWGIDASVDARGVASLVYWDDVLASVPKTAVQRISNGGQLLSTSVYDGATHHGARPAGLVRGAAGQTYVCGSEGSGFGALIDEAFVMQQDQGGATNWVRRFPGNGFGPAIGRGLAAPGNRLVLVGTTYTTPGFDYDALLMQIDVSEAPQAYCTAKLNSLGCTPRIGFTGLSSAAAGSGFALIAEQVRNNKSGLFFYGVTGSASTPFGGGILCVAAPVRRTPASSSAGTAAPANDCSGVFSIDINAFARGVLGGSPIAALRIPGTAVYTQVWGRDPGFSAPNNITLSNALRYVVLP